jgi:hypothetical protein
MSEAEFERRLANGHGHAKDEANDGDENGPAVIPVSTRGTPGVALATEPEPDPAPSPRGSSGTSRGRGKSVKSSKARRVERMFAIEEDLDKKLWLYAIHLGKDRSEVINDLLRPVVSSMVLYDSRDRRASRSSDSDNDAAGEGG